MPNQSSHRQFLYLAIGYALLLVYGTLFPLSHFQIPAENPFTLMLQHNLRSASRADIITNILIYMPFGWFLMKSIPGRDWPLCNLLIAVMISVLFSLSLEYTQAYLPERVSAVSDIILNSFGAFTGAFIALLIAPDAFPGNRLVQLRRRYILPGHLASLGLIVLGFWALSQLSPLVPSIDVKNIRYGIKPLVHTLADPSTLEWVRVIEYALGTGALGILASTLQRTRFHALRRFAGFSIVILVLKIPVISRQLSLESLVGFATGLFIAFLALSLSIRQRLVVALLTLAGTVLAAGLYAPANRFQLATAAFNWVPFRGHLSNNITGIVDILGGLWPFIAFGYLGLLSMKTHRHRFLIAISGAILIFFMMFALEWHQRSISGRSADITDAILPVLGWLFPWLYPSLWREHKAGTGDITAKPSSARTASPGKWTLIGGMMFIATVGAVIWGMPDAPLEYRLNGNRLPILPAPQQTPPAKLNGFNYQHPRLPAPTPEQVALIKKYNPGYLKAMEEKAEKRNGELFPVIFGAYVAPGSQDLSIIYRRLIDLKPSWHGHQQAKTLALAYDWLFAQWTSEQRLLLRRKIIQASYYLIERIRTKERLSPYNVVLYNGPLQALTATSLVAYGDDPVATPPMNWFSDYWKSSVLPVWRQVMGKNGGWHEGGEYVSIGIGQVIYQVPAMWREATGENLFETEPGIRGFLDFLIYRTRPDGTRMRWGDGTFFDNKVSNRIPLAIEFDDSAAYSLNGCPKPYQPSAWPWGPLTTNDLCDQDSIKKRPLQKYFDGIGMVIARSDWDDDATYLTFKAGDNFWSHSHLDQGAFTLYKGSPLAVDSGFGPRYGTDHYMNYSYQSIAHNLITVTDPADNMRITGKKNQSLRQIANDGGQRRIGSGWGVEPAPVDLNEWLNKQEIYHTGRIEQYYAGDDLVVAVADITPAYTNRYSGKGTFSHRTRRVERYWRTLVYDRINDLVIVYDDVIATDPSFQKRSLIHTIEEPIRSQNGFETRVSAGQYPGRNKGTLKATILFPREPTIDIVGGQRRSFLVAGVNYESGGKIWEKVTKRRSKNGPEPGFWRVELSSPITQKRDRFLMILEPGIEGIPQSHPEIERLVEKGGIGSRITGHARVLTLLFPPDRNGVIIDIQGPVKKKLDLTLDTDEKQPIKSLWQKLRDAFRY